MSALVLCPSCAAKLPPDSRFCPQCGTRLAAGETLEMNPAPVVNDPSVANGTAEPGPPAVHYAHRRPLGAHPVPLLGGLGSLALLLAIILLATGWLVAGLVLLALATALLTLYAGGVRHDRDAPTAGLSLAAADRARSLAGLVLASGHAWSHAGIRLLGIRSRQRRLRAELKAHLTPLGEAVHHDEHQRAQALRQQAAELEHQLNKAEEDASAAIADARQEVEQHRRTIQPTEAFEATGAARGPASPPRPENVTPGSYAPAARDRHRPSDR